MGCLHRYHLMAMLDWVQQLGTFRLQSRHALQFLLFLLGSCLVGCNNTSRAPSGNLKRIWYLHIFSRTTGTPSALLLLELLYSLSPTLRENGSHHHKTSVILEGVKDGWFMAQLKFHVRLFHTLRLPATPRESGQYKGSCNEILDQTSHVDLRLHDFQSI